MWRIALLVLTLAISACQQEDEPVDYGLAGFDPHQAENLAAACVEKGGRYGKGALSGSFVCYQETRDANKPCSSANDCDGLCLAKSRSCAPIKPLLGCHEVLTNAGNLTTVCRQ